MREAYRLLALEIRSAFLQLTIDRASHRVARFNEDLMRRRLAVIETRVNSGELSPGAGGPQQMLVNEASFATERAGVAFDRNLQAFRKLTGQPDFSAENIPEEIPDIPRIPSAEVTSLNGGFWERRMQDGRYEGLQFRVEQQRLDLQIARVAQRPTVNLVGGYSMDQLTYVNVLGQRTSVQSFYIGVGVNWNIFDGGATRGRIMTSRTRLRQLEDQLSALDEDLRMTSNLAGTDVEFAARSLKLAEDRFGATLAGFNLTQENVERRRASQDDLEEVRNRLNASQLAMFGARAAYLNAIATWLHRIDADPIVPPVSSLPPLP
jgi:outer membrane protein TolC